MSIIVIKPGLQTTLQGKPYRGYRDIGMPAAGAADGVSLALANRLVGKEADALSIEITLLGAEFLAHQEMAVALTGAASYFRINGIEKPLHRTTVVQPTDKIAVGPAQSGCRSYLSFSQYLKSEMLLGGQSTYTPAKMGGFKGRALARGDELSFTGNTNQLPEIAVTPDPLNLVINDSHVLRITAGFDLPSITNKSKTRFVAEPWTVADRCSRMGLMLEGGTLETSSNAAILSAPVFPGTIQCPPDGHPFLLGPDAQTTGGYPQIGQVIRADRHLIGQLKPGSKLRLVPVSLQQATEIYRKKLMLLKPWLGAIDLW